VASQQHNPFAILNPALTHHLPRSNLLQSSKLSHQFAAAEGMTNRQGHTAMATTTTSIGEPIYVLDFQT
jgi:hypothetical protein